MSEQTIQFKKKNKQTGKNTVSHGEDMQNAHTLMTRWPPDHAKVTNDIKSWVPASTYCAPDQINKSSKLTKMSRDTATTLTRA